MRQDRRYYAVTYGLTALVTLALIVSWIRLLGIHDSIEAGLITQIDRKTIVSKLWVEVIGFGSLGLAALGIAFRAWRRSSPILVQENVAAIRAARAESPGGPSRLGPALLRAAKKIAGGGMRECEDFQQWLGHLLTMWGFLGLFLTTAIDAVVNRAADPLPLLHPVRLLGNVTGIMLMAGLTLALLRRALLDRARHATRIGDWTFLISLWGTGATGFLVQWYADTANQGGTAWSYLVHLASVGLILGSAPWTKFVHAAWRPTWVLHRELTLKRTS